MKSKKKCLIVSLYGQNSGGGASFLEDTMQWLYQIDFQCIWINFSNFDNSNHKHTNIFETYYGFIVNHSNGFSTNIINDWIQILSPDVIHHQGHKRLEIALCAERARVPFITGIHFWNGIINLSSKTSNFDILQHIDHHTIHPEFSLCNNLQYLNWYCCSEFVQNIVNKVCKIQIKEVVSPCSSIQKIKCDYDSVKKARFITQINIHKHKGGELFLALIKKLKDFSFLAVQTEPLSHILDQQIKSEIAHNPLSKFLLFTPNIKEEVYSQSRILLAPSLVDETFCRTVNEAMCCGIPVITTGKGYIKYMVEQSAIILDEYNIDAWVHWITKLYCDQNLWDEYSLKVRLQYQKCNESVAANNFQNLISSTVLLDSLNRSNIMLFVPFSSQGLGIQALNYIKAWQLSKIPDKGEIVVFGYKPYVKTQSLDDKILNKFGVKCSTYSSLNDRENVTDQEIIDFVNKYKIGYTIIPETCWFRVFEICKLLKSLRVKTFAIPNIEIIRQDELSKHSFFDVILCNNKLTFNTLIDHGFDSNKVKLLGYQHCLLMHKSKLKNPSDKIKFLCLGGLNAISRKRCHRICQAFIDADISCFASLTVTYQKHSQYTNIDLLEKFIGSQSITLIDKNLDYFEILDLYKSHDIFIQVSLCEGLGLGFYESLLMGTPIITINCKPYNEIISCNNGWFINGFDIDILENNNSIIKGNDFLNIDLKNLFEYLISNLEDIKQKQLNIFDMNQFESSLKRYLFGTCFANFIH